MNLSPVGTTPDEVLEAVKQNVFANLNCHGIGKITAFDKTKQTCTIEIMQLKKTLNRVIYPSIICDVPLLIYGTSDAFITLPNPVGTVALLMFMDRNIDDFMETNETYQPATGRMHDMTDCIAITTFKTLVNPITNYDDTAITLQYNKIVESIAFTSIIKDYGNSIKLNVTNNNNINTTLELSDKIKVENATRNLKTLIQSLITTIKAITISNSAVSSASQQALEDISVQFGELLQ